MTMRLVVRTDVYINMYRQESEVIVMGKKTSKRVASIASKILRDGRYGKDAKSVAGSALAQTKSSRKN